MTNLANPNPKPVMRKLELCTQADNELRHLRLWHWLKFLGYTAEAEAHERMGRACQRSRAYQRAGTHMKAVQALNLVVSGAGTAQQDVDEGMRCLLSLE